MFRKAALIFAILAGVTLANAKAIDPALTTGAGQVLTHPGSPMTIVRVDHNSIRVHFIGHFQGRDGAVHYTLPVLRR